MACSHGRRHPFPESAGHLLAEKAQHCSLPFPFRVVVQAATRPSSTSSSLSPLSYCDVHRTQPAAARAQHSSLEASRSRLTLPTEGKGGGPAARQRPALGPGPVGSLGCALLPGACRGEAWVAVGLRTGDVRMWSWRVLSLCIRGCQRKGKTHSSPGAMSPGGGAAPGATPRS